MYNHITALVALALTIPVGAMAQEYTPTPASPCVEMFETMVQKHQKVFSFRDEKAGINCGGSFGGRNRPVRFGDSVTRREVATALLGAYETRTVSGPNGSITQSNQAALWANWNVGVWNGNQPMSAGGWNGLVQNAAVSAGSLDRRINQIGAVATGADLKARRAQAGLNAWNQTMFASTTTNTTGGN